MFFHKRLGAVLTAVCMLLLWSTSTPHTEATTAAQLSGGLQMVQSSSANLSFQLQVPDIIITADGQITATGLDTYIQEQGAPALPAYTAVVAVPPNATTQVNVTEAQTQWLNQVSLRPVGQPAPIIDEANDMIIGLNMEIMDYAPNSAIYTADALYPAQLYDVSPVQYARDVRFITVTLYPVRYNPVTQELRHTAELNVNIHFDYDAAGVTTQPIPTHSDSATQNLAAMALNGKQIDQWRSAAHHLRAPQAADVDLPTGQTAYKIAVDEEGIYEVTYADLAAQGLTGTPATNTIEMMHNGDSVAYQLLDNNSNDLFDSGDAIRFYGWAYDGTRFEKFYVNDNIFWLWFDGIATTLETETAAPTGSVITTTFATASFGEDLVFAHPYFSEDNVSIRQDNDSDYLMWQRTYPTDGENFDYLSVPVDLPYVIDGGGTAIFTVEIQSGTRDYTVFPSAPITVEIGSESTSHTFRARENVNMTLSVPFSQLSDTNNEIRIYGGEDAYTITPEQRIFLNEVHVDYARTLSAETDQLFFETTENGTFEFQIDNFSETDINNIVLWDVTNRLQPVALSGFTTPASGEYAFGRVVTGNNQFAAAAVNQLKSGSVTAYTVTDITPSGGAEWLAVTHSTLRDAAETLAAHRDTQGYSTHVINFEDIANQYGYGFPTPHSIEAYLADAFDTWLTPPSYLTIVGDADVNPRLLTNINSTINGGDFSYTNPNQVPTHMSFKDRFNGLTPSDHPYSLIIGTDDIPDLAVGRITAETLPQANTQINKIIKYEENLLTPADWQTDMLFVHDNADSGGDFKSSIELGTLPYLDDAIDTTIIGLETGSLSEVADVRNEMFGIINGLANPEHPEYPQNVSILNYRGHGSINRWAEGILKSADNTLFTNTDTPIVSLSFDCLDGHFAFPDWTSLSESLLRYNDGGSAAHWSSSGLGYDYEHTRLAQGFYEGIFDLGYTAIGDAVNYAKISSASSIHESEIYSYILQGDPAMQLYKPELEVTIDAPTGPVSQNDTVDITLTADNSGSYPTQAVISYTVPADLTYVSHTATYSVTHTATPAGNNETRNVFTFNDTLANGETAAIDITFTAEANLAGTTTAVISGPGLDISPNTGRIAVADIGDSSNTTLEITGQPQSQTVEACATATFSVSTSGANPMTYQWYKDGQLLTGEQSNTLAINPVSTSDAGEYTVQVENIIGTIVSDVATLTVTGDDSTCNAVAPTITNQPQNQTVAQCTSTSFSVTASGTRPFTYQWSKDGDELTNETSNTLTLSDISPADAGTYTVTVTNPVSTVTSTTATLTVTDDDSACFTTNFIYLPLVQN